MIQRIQSLYLLISTALITVALHFPIVQFSGVDDFMRILPFEMQTSVDGILWITARSYWSLGAFFVCAAALTLVAIFLFQKRRLQIKFSRYSFIFKLGVLIVVAFDSYKILNSNVEVLNWNAGLALLLLLIAAVLDWLAIKAIRKDDDLVRSIDRIR